MGLDLLRVGVLVPGSLAKAFSSAVGIFEEASVPRFAELEGARSVIVEETSRGAFAESACTGLLTHRAY